MENQKEAMANYYAIYVGREKMKLKDFIPEEIYARHLKYKKEQAIKQMMVKENITHDETGRKIAMKEYIKKRMVEENISREEAERRTEIDKFMDYLERLPPMAIVE